MLGTTLLTLTSCGGKGGSGGAVPAQSNPQVSTEVLTDAGIYRAVLSPLNTGLGVSTSGTVEIKIEGDDVRVKSNIIGAPAGVKHLQNIMVAQTCPDQASDTNADTVIDIKESLAKTGQILIPLDSDLSSQLSGNDYGPIANNAGSFVYRRSASLTQMLSDLLDRDPDTLDPIVKLPAGNNMLALSNRVVVIHGVKSSADLPATVASFDGVPAELLVPIACGNLVRVTSEENTPVVTVDSGSNSSR